MTVEASVNVHSKVIDRSLPLAAPAKKRGRTAQPKEPKPPKMPKPPKEPKAKPGPKPKKGKEGQEADGTQEKMDETVQKVRKKRDRFKGMTEDEVMSRTLTDILDYNLDYVIVSSTSVTLCQTLLLMI